jgi:hypothetical protein
VLLFFNEIFDGLCKVRLSLSILLIMPAAPSCTPQLYADVDIDVKNGAQLLGRPIAVCVLSAKRDD